ncbi:hypothetical protein ACFL55_00495 [Candidatus Latescibacterota bacterium]
MNVYITDCLTVEYDLMSAVILCGDVSEPRVTRIGYGRNINSTLPGEIV